MKKILALGALVSLGMSSAALADGALADNSAQGVQGGAYIGGGLGIGGMNTPKSYLPLGKGVANLKQSRKLRSGVTYRVDAGYLFPVTSHLLLGAEVGYTGYPQNKYNQDGDFWLKTKVHTRLNYSGHMFDVLGVAKYYFGNHFNVFAKAGAADVYQKTSFNMYETGDKQQVVDSIAFTKKVNKILPEAAVGVGYDFTPAIGVNVTYSHVFGTKPKFVLPNSGNKAAFTKQIIGTAGKVASINTVMAGLTFKFNM